MTRWKCVIILVVLGCFRPIAQADDDVLLIKQFEHVYSGPSPSSNAVLGMVPTGDGGFFLVVEGDSKLLATKTDRNGYVGWRKELQYGPPGGLSRAYSMRLADSVKQTADGGYIIGGEMTPGISNPDGYDPADGFLIRLDAHGNKLWDIAIGAPGHDRLSPVEVAPDGGFVAAGFSTSSNRKALLAKVSDDGQLLWKKHYEEPIGRWFEDLAVAHGNDGYVLGGRVLLKTDLQGNVVQVHAFDPSQFVYVYRVLRIPGGGYAVAGAAASQQSWVLRISKFDGNLNTDWSRTYSDYAGRWDLAHGFDVAKDGFLVAGNTALFAFVLHVNWGGNIVRAWKKITWQFAPDMSRPPG